MWWFLLVPSRLTRRFKGSVGTLSIGADSGVTRSSLVGPPVSVCAPRGPSQSMFRHVNTRQHVNTPLGAGNGDRVGGVQNRTRPWTHVIQRKLERVHRTTFWLCHVLTVWITSKQCNYVTKYCPGVDLHFFNVCVTYVDTIQYARQNMVNETRIMFLLSGDFTVIERFFNHCCS